MGLEVVTYISDFNIDWPLGKDIRRFGDDHIRNCKIGPYNTFSGFLPSSDSGFEVMIRTQAELNSVVDRVLRAGDTMEGPLYGYQVTPLADLEFVVRQWVLDLYNGLIEGSCSVYGYGITELFKSTEESLVANTLQTFAHGLSRAPDALEIQLRCISADAGWAVDDVLEVSGAQSNDTVDNTETGGIQLAANSNDISWQVGGRVWVNAKNTGTFTEIDLTKWKAIVIGYLIE